MPDITFSVKPITLKDQALLQKVQAGDSGALIELIVRRADPPVLESVVGDLTVVEVTPVVERLAASLGAVQSLDTLISAALKDT